MERLTPGAGEVIADSPERRVELLADHDALHATWSRFGPRRDGADLHVHRRHTDLFYVLEGELTLRLGLDGEAVVAPAGALVRVPPLVVHGFRNGGDADVRYLNLHAPGEGFADYMRGLRDGRQVTYDQHEPPADGGRPIREAVVGGAGVVAEQPGVRTELLADVEAIGIAETSAEGGAVSSPPHVHRRHVETHYVLDGELVLARGDCEVRARAGTWLEVPADVAHGLSAAEPVRFLSLHTPGCGFGAFVRALGDAGGDEETAAAAAGFDQELAA